MPAPSAPSPEVSYRGAEHRLALPGCAARTLPEAVGTITQGEKERGEKVALARSDLAQNGGVAAEL